jgi:glutaredoxin-dependent peroxiredoxin
MKNFQKNLKSLEASDTQVLGVSMDSPFANKAFGDQIGVTFPLLSDWGGKTSKEYGVLQQIGKLNYEASRRVTYLIDKNGKITHVQVDEEAIDPKKIVQACERKKHTS